MSSRELIDAQFNRAVEIVQGLPKTGPIQTDYEEKLTMYSLYKQATSGNVKSPRPGIWDMLGRAKWDAWEKHKDLDPYEAKWLYVETLMKVLRKYSDKTVARSLVQELESFGGDPFNLVMSGSITRDDESDDSASTTSEDERSRYLRPPQITQRPGSTTDDEDSGDDKAGDLPRVRPELDSLQQNRPGSSLSAHRYRTPMTGSVAMSPPPASHPIPATQPLPEFETPSAFGGDRAVTPAQSTIYPRSQSSGPELPGSPPTNLYPLHMQFRANSQPMISQFGPYVPVRPATRPAVERAVENVQSQLAAINERLETLETLYLPDSRSHSSLGQSGPGGSGHNWPRRPRPDSPRWDFDDLGMWSLVLNPLQKAVEQMRTVANFFTKNENRSPSAIILRRLCLDVTFLLACLLFVRTLWKKSGARRRDVNAALVVLWKAILGTKDRSMVDRGI